MNFLQILFSAIVEKLKGTYEAIHDRIKYGSSGGGFSFSPQGVREAANRNPIVVAVAIGIVVIGGMIYALKDTVFTGGAPAFVPPSNKWYYSDDDGATYFADDKNKIAPFDHNGKQALRAHVFTCDMNRTRFVGYLERQTPGAAAAVAKIPPDELRSNPDAIPELLVTLREVKSPKAPATTWAGTKAKEYSKISNPHCPDGKTDLPDEVLP